jgi:hypothetical protein
MSSDHFELRDGAVSVLIRLTMATSQLAMERASAQSCYWSAAEGADGELR